MEIRAKSDCFLSTFSGSEKAELTGHLYILTRRVITLTYPIEDRAMSLESAIAFYQALDSNEDLHRSYQQHCSDLPQQPAVEPEQAGLPQWQEEKILHFAANQGYRFSLGELYRVWFGQEDYRVEREAPAGWRMQAIAALNRQMGDRFEV